MFYNSSRKNSSYFILKLFSKHFPIESIIWNKLKKNNKSHKAYFPRLVKSIQQFLSKKSELTPEQDDAIQKLLEIIRNPKKFLVVKKGKKIIIFKDDQGEMNFINKCNEICTKIEEGNLIISKTSDQSLFSEQPMSFVENQNEKFKMCELNSNFNSLPTFESSQNSYCYDDSLQNYLNLESKQTNADMKKNYKDQNQSYYNNDFPQNKFPLNVKYENRKGQKEGYEGLNMEKEYELLKKRYDLLLQEKDVWISENQYLREQLKKKRFF